MISYFTPLWTSTVRARCEGYRESVSIFFDETHVRQILQSLDVVDVISNYVALRPRGKEMVGLCPFHQDRRPSLTVNRNKQLFKCFACGAGGDVIKFIMLREHLTFPETVRLLADRAGIQLPAGKGQTHEQTGPGRNELEAVNRWAARFFRKQFEDDQAGSTARQYVIDRGINAETAECFGLGWAPDKWDGLYRAAERDGVKIAELVMLGLLIEKQTGGYYDRFRQRLMFPVYDALGRLIGFGGRTLGDDAAKYLNSPESALFDKSRALYGINTAKDAIVKQRQAIVVEGYTDCIMARQCGIENVVATLGTALTDEHAKTLTRYSDRIVLVFDSDQAGQKAAERAIEVFFTQHIEVFLATLPTGTDPCDFLLANGKQAFIEYIEGATEATEYKWLATCKRAESGNSVADRRRAVDEFLELIAGSYGKGRVDAIGQGFLAGRVAQLLGLPIEQVHARLGQLGRRQRSRPANRGGSTAAAEQYQQQDGCTNSERELLEVLLNRPDLVERVREIFARPDDFEGQTHRQVAEQIWQYCDSGGDLLGGSLGQMTAACSSTEICRIMTDMAERGEDRGNFENTLDGALENVLRIRAERSRSQVRQMVGTAAEKYGQDAETAMLMDIQARLGPDPRRAGAR